MVFKTRSTIRCDNTPMAYQTFTHQIWWVMVCYDLAHQIKWAKHTFSGRCDITPMVCCSFGGHTQHSFYSVCTDRVRVIFLSLLPFAFFPFPPIFFCHPYSFFLFSVVPKFFIRTSLIIYYITHHVYGELESFSCLF